MGRSPMPVMRSLRPAGISSPAVLSAAMLKDFCLRLPQMPSTWKIACVFTFSRCRLKNRACFGSAPHRFLVVARILVFRRVGETLLRLAVLRAQREHRFHPFHVYPRLPLESVGRAEQHAIGGLRGLRVGARQVLQKNCDGLLPVPES